MEQVVDTMLHELSHNVFGPHDEKFHALWDELRKEYEGLVSKGYTGEGFLSNGNRLGGRRMPHDEAMRIRRAAAEKRAVLSKGSGQKLGGAAVPLGSDMRKVIADAIERRSTITKGCGSGGNKNSQEIEAISDQANRNGFKTKALEDMANESAIAQALWELHQEDEMQKYGSAYVPPTMSSGFDTRSGSDVSQASSSSSAPRSPILSHKDRLGPSLPDKWPAPSPYPPRSKTDPVATIKTENENPKFWTCPACTFAENPMLHLCCDICETEQPMSVTHAPARPKAVSNSKYTKPAPAVPISKTWFCHKCANEMENQWWTCSECGTFKLESKN